ncbi:hypothetical protein Dimus_002732 [Dionaea muscipula]
MQQKIAFTYRKNNRLPKIEGGGAEENKYTETWNPKELEIRVPLSFMDSLFPFYDAMSVPMAIALSGQPLLGQPVMVKPSEAEKNLVQSTAAAGGAGGLAAGYSGGGRRLYVGNLHTL